LTASFSSLQERYEEWNENDESNDIRGMVGKHGSDGFSSFSATWSRLSNLRLWKVRSGRKLVVSFLTAEAIIFIFRDKIIFTSGR
jgi:hypothetical protein